MGKAKRVRKARMKRNQFRVGLRKIVASAKESERALKLKCLLNGHDFRENVFKYGDSVCIRCGQPNPACSGLATPSALDSGSAQPANR